MNKSQVHDALSTEKKNKIRKLALDIKHVKEIKPREVGLCID